MTTAAELASYASSFPSFRNRIINGNLSNPIKQRGISTITGATGYTYDRWYYDGSTYLYQGIEDKNVNNGTYVISWEGSGINAAWKVSTDTTANNGPDATTGFTSVSNGGTFTVNEGTEYSKHLWIRFDGTLANLNKVQVEEGTVATPFEHRPYGAELALCQRYFQQGPLTAFPTQIGSSTTYFATNFRFATSMRTTPSTTFFAPTSGNSGKIERWGGFEHTVSSVNFGSNNAGVSQVEGIIYVIISSGIAVSVSLGAVIKAEAEL
jgi:hypothetical protein